MEGTPLKLLLDADDLPLLSSTRGDLQLGLDLLYDYCTRWRLLTLIKQSLRFLGKVVTYPSMTTFLRT